MKFSQEMELEFFGRLLQDKEYIGRFIGVLRDYQASSFAMEWIREELVEWCDKYGGIPTIEFWDSKASNELDGERKDQVTAVVKNLLKREDRFSEFAKDQFLDFMASMCLEKYIDEGKSLFQSKMDINLYLSKVTQGLVEAEKAKFGSDPDQIFDWLEQRSKRESRRGLISEGLKLGIPKLDDQFVSRRGTVTVFLGAYKRYKSIMLHHCGFAALLQGYNVLHVSYENTLQQVGDRYDSRFTGVEYKRMVRNLISAEEAEGMNIVFEKLDKLSNRLKIQLCKPYKDTVGVTNTAIDKLVATGWNPDLILFDYMNLVSCDKRIDDDYKRIELACWDMQELSKVRDSIVISACQAQKGAEDQESLKGSDTAGSVGILRAADNQIAINQTSDEYKAQIIRISPIHFRDDEIVSRDIPLNHELTRMCVCRDSDELWNEVEDT